MVLRGRRIMTDDRLMAMARAAGYSMIPPQDAFDAGPEADAPADAGSEQSASADTSALHRLRTWAGQSANPVTAMRDAVTNWYHGRAHA